MRAMWRDLVASYQDDGELKAAVQKFVCHQLAWQGYTPADRWSQADADTNLITAKSLLLALGWLISRCNLFERYFDAAQLHLRELEPQCLPWPSQRTIDSAADAANHTLQAGVLSVDAEAGLSIADKAQQVLTEHGRLLHTARQLSQMQMERSRQQHRLQKLATKLCSVSLPSFCCIQKHCNNSISFQITSSQVTLPTLRLDDVELMLDVNLQAQHAAAHRAMMEILKELELVCQICSHLSPRSIVFIILLLTPVDRDGCNIILDVDAFALTRGAVFQCSRRSTTRLLEW